ncbi:MAG: hypothetical protein PHO15_10990 [Eubacteriales bacterium]|nr:hypothetical protein [Eubacteriales bacterium]
MDISIFELFFFVFIACAWPISIARMIKNKSTKGKSLIFLCIILIGYAFGIVHKYLYDLDAVVFFYFLNFILVLGDIIVFLYTKNKYEKGAA